jgi:hypothetical protein
MEELGSLVILAFLILKLDLFCCFLFIYKATVSMFSKVPSSLIFEKNPCSPRTLDHMNTKFNHTSTLLHSPSEHQGFLGNRPPPPPPPPLCDSVVVVVEFNHRCLQIAEQARLPTSCPWGATTFASCPTTLSGRFTIRHLDSASGEGSKRRGRWGSRSSSSSSTHCHLLDQLARARRTRPRARVKLRCHLNDSRRLVCHTPNVIHRLSTLFHTHRL